MNLEKIKKIIQTDKYIAWFIFLFSFVIYIKTLSPSVYEGDSGELIAAANVLGVAHPTGFPLYLLLSKLFITILPFGSVAYRVNLLSAFFASLTAVLSFYIMRELKIKKVASLTTALLLAFSGTFWSHATSARVYSMSGFFVALLILLALKWQKTKNTKLIYIFAFVLGLGLGTHLTTGIVGFFFLVIIFTKDKKILLNKKILGYVALFFAIPLLQYIYIPIASSKHPLVNHDNPENLKNFIYYITQRDYAFKIGNREKSLTLKVIWQFCKFIFWEFTPVGFALILLGSVLTWLKNKAIFIGIITMVVINVALMVSYGNEYDFFTLFRYFLPAYIALAIFIGFALDFILKQIQKLKKVDALVFTILLSFIPLVSIKANYENLDRSQNYIVLDYSQNILKTSPIYKSLFFVSGDAVSGPLWYLQSLNETKDHVIIEQNLLTHDWYTKQLIEYYPEFVPEEIMSVEKNERLNFLIKKNMGILDIFSTTINQNLPEEYKEIPVGLLNKILPKEYVINPNILESLNAQIWNSYNLRGVFDKKLHYDYMIKDLLRAYAKAHNNLGVFFANEGFLEKAKIEYELAIRFKEDHFESLFNLSNLLKEEGNNEEAYILLQRAKEVNPDFFEKNKAPDNTVFQQDLNYSKDPDAIKHANTAIELGQQGLFEDAINEFEKAIEIDPNFDASYINLAMTYTQMENYELAIVEFEKAKRLFPNIPTIYLNLGSLYKKQENYTKVRENWEKLLELNPDFPQKENILAELARMPK